jgi:hypothetical protein
VAADRRFRILSRVMVALALVLPLLLWAPIFAGGVAAPGPGTRAIVDQGAQSKVAPDEAGSPPEGPREQSGSIQLLIDAAREGPMSRSSQGPTAKRCELPSRLS